MAANYKNYCDNTIPKKISLDGFMKGFSLANDRQKIIGLWTGTTMFVHHGICPRSVPLERICTAYVPRDQSDSSMAGCVRLFGTLE
ncbi:hypothetical protein BGX30_008641, partial [Mortierella sp. GBA39]